MKSILIGFMTVLSFSLPGWAAEFSAADMVTGTHAALKVFSDENADHVVHVSGFKTWKSGTDSKVKIYVAHDGMNMEYNYLCQIQDDQINCSSL